MNEPIQLRWYQEEAIQALFNYFNNPVRAYSLEPANPLICLPTGTGKSIVIAEFIRRVMQLHPTSRLFAATHVKELISQNVEKLKSIWPLAPVGIYSSGLNSKESSHPIVFGGIQSAVKKFPIFGRRDLLLIDEAHLLSPKSDTSYIKFIEELKHGANDLGLNNPNINPYLKVIGFTATPYRLGLGCMTNGPIFRDIVYDLCNMEGFARLIADGYLCPLITKKTATQLDVSNVKLQNGEFAQGQLQEAVDKDAITYAALQETVYYGQDRQSWLLFASGIEHAEHIAEMLNTAFGIPTVCIHSKKTDKQNAQSLEDWKAGRARAAVNMNALTTGVDHPACDLIAMLRPSMSTGLWVQMLGRGTRPSHNKLNCLVLDFAGNTRRLGPINDPVIPNPKGKGPPGNSPVKICETCFSYNHIKAKFCVVCGTEFIFKPNINKQASELEVMRSDIQQIEIFNVDRVVMTPHISKNSGKSSIKISYFCGLRTFYEYISVESEQPYFLHISREWFRQRYHYNAQNSWFNDVPPTNNDVLNISNELRWPKTISVHVNTKIPKILGYQF